MASFVTGLFGFIVFLVWLGVVVFVITLAIRLVKAVEKIAVTLENQKV